MSNYGLLLSVQIWVQEKGWGEYIFLSSEEKNNEPSEADGLPLTPAPELKGNHPAGKTRGGGGAGPHPDSSCESSQCGWVDRHFGYCELGFRTLSQDVPSGHL